MTVSFSLPPEHVAVVEQLAKAKGLSKSDALVLLIDKGMEALGPEVKQ